MYKAITCQNNYQNIVSQIKQMILNGELKTGDKLPVERELAEILNVSRSCVREAMKALETLGLLECRQGGGNYIVNHLDDALSDSLSLVYVLNHCHMDDLTELRQMIETDTLKKLAAENIPSELEDFRQLRSEILASRSMENVVRGDLKFHRLLSAKSKNPLLNHIQSTVNSLYLSSVQTLNDNYENKMTLEEAIAYQTDILNALFSRDPSAIEQAIVRHYNESYETLRGL